MLFFIYSFFFFSIGRILFQIGMSLVIHVGDDDDLPEKPENFPKCYDWPRMTSDAQDKPGSGAHRIVSNILILCATRMFILQNKII